MTSPVMRVRFAPSPTGFLHVGGARTALFNWLLARKHGGVFVLRVEDTDKERSSEEMTHAILDGMTWLGLQWDEGPFHQADGLERHRRDAESLLDSGAGYRCFCTPEELDEERAAAAAIGQKYRYDRRCLRLPAEDAERRWRAGEPFTIRFHVPEGRTAWDDVVHGTISFANEDLEDFVVVRSDGTPIYNFAVVSDDLAMRITHVIRGDDHISNTPKQILLYRALGQQPPVFGHVPMILGSDGKRLSKRHGATAIGEYREQGILPEAMVNFLALLGWAPGDDREIFTVPELIEAFSLEGINRKSAIFDTTKLLWLNGQHLSLRAAGELEHAVGERLVRAGFASAGELSDRREWFLHLIDLLKVRARNLDDIVRQARPYFPGNLDYDAEAVAKHWKQPGEVAERLDAVASVLSELPDWEHGRLEAAVRGLAAERGISAGKIIHPLRVAVTGLAVSAGIFEVLVAMGRELTLQRLREAAEFLRTTAESGAG